MVPGLQFGSIQSQLKVQFRPTWGRSWKKWCGLAIVPPASRRLPVALLSSLPSRVAGCFLLSLGGFSARPQSSGFSARWLLSPGGFSARPYSSGFSAHWILSPGGFSAHPHSSGFYAHWILSSGGFSARPHSSGFSAHRILFFKRSAPHGAPFLISGGIPDRLADTGK